MYTSMVGEKQTWTGAQQQVGTFFSGCRAKSSRSKQLRGMEGLLEAISQLLPYNVITQFSINTFTLKLHLSLSDYTAINLYIFF